MAADPHLRRAFRIHAWKELDLEQEMIAGGFIGIGGSELGDLSAMFDKEDLRDPLTDRSACWVGPVFTFGRECSEPVHGRPTYGADDERRGVGAARSAK